MNNDTIITIDEILQSYDKPLPDQKEFTKEELEVIAEFDEFEANVRKNYVPIPQRKNYLSHLLQAGYTPTLCYSGTKKSFVKEWQNKFWIEEKDEFWEKCEEYNFDLNYGILTGLAQYNNLICIDFDIKQFVIEEQQKLIDLINSLTETEYIQTLILSKKIFVEKSVSNGFHFVVSISDLEERKGVKLLDYSGRKKPNKLIKEEHIGTGEVIETRAKGQHFVCYPSYGYQKIHNVIWELQKLETEEYTQLEQFVIDFFLNLDSIKFTKANEKNEVVTSKKIRLPKSERNISNVFDVVIEQLKQYQSTFAKSGKDISIISELLQKNGYTLISENPEYYYFIHPLSSKAEPNLALSRLNHCITNFSGNNPDFPTTKSVGTLPAFYILQGSKHSVSEIIQILRFEYKVILVRTAEEILQDANNKITNK